MAVPNQGPVSQRYTRLKSIRDPFLQRARACALLTIPTLIPPEGASGSTVYYTPFQSVGSRGVNALSAKFLLALLPPNAPFFRYLLDDFTIQELAGDDQGRAKIEEALNQVERAIVADLESSSVRAPVFEMVKHLVVAGNYLTYSHPETGDVRGFPLSNYVVKRSPSGVPLETIVFEKLSPVEVPETYRGLIAQPTKDSNQKQDVEDTVELYTLIRRLDDGRYEAHQELNGHTLSDTLVTYEKDACPWFPARLIITPDDYGRSYVEELYGDLRSLEGLTKAMVKGGAIAAKVLFLLRPGAASTPRDLTQAETGEFRVGIKDDVSVVQAEKYADFRFVLTLAQDLERRLGLAFLLNSSVQRSGERVTAEEIRLMVQDLDAALGGLYSSLAQDWQLPFVRCRAQQLEVKGKLPKLPKETIRPTITSGVEAIGRGNDYNRLMQFFASLEKLNAAPDPYLNGEDARKRLATSLQLDPKGLVKTQDEVDEEMQAAAQQEAAMTAIPNAVKQAGDMLSEQAPQA